MKEDRSKRFYDFGLEEMNFEKSKMLDRDDVSEVNELMRRKDVAELIENKIEEESDFEDIKMANNPVKAKLEELLEEIK